MKLTVSIPQQEIIDWNRKCYAILSISQTTSRIWGVGLTQDEAKDMVRARFDTILSKNTKERTLQNLDKLTEDEKVRNYGIPRNYLQLAECDMKIYLYNTKNPGRDKFIFECAHVPYKIKYTRRIHER